MIEVINVLLLFILTIATISYLGFIKNYKKCKNIQSKLDLSGLEISREILEKNNLDNLYVVKSNDKFNSHYDINRKVIRLSKDVFDENDLASIAIASFNTSIAIIDDLGDILLKFKSFFQKIITLSTKFAYLLLLCGYILNDMNVIYISLLLFLVYIIFYIILIKIDYEAFKLTIDNLKKYNHIEEVDFENIEKLLKSYVFYNFALLIIMPYSMIEFYLRKN